MSVDDLPPEENKSSSSSSESASIEQLPSSLSSISIQGDIDELGGETVYQPLVIPREPKLDELLVSDVNKSYNAIKIIKCLYLKSVKCLALKIYKL